MTKAPVRAMTVKTGRPDFNLCMILFFTFYSSSNARGTSAAGGHCSCCLESCKNEIGLTSMVIEELFGARIPAMRPSNSGVEHDGDGQPLPAHLPEWHRLRLR